jgi:hypothetical protein
MPKEISSSKKKVKPKLNPNYLDSKTTEKILLQAQELEEEEENDKPEDFLKIEKLKQEEEAYENESIPELDKEEEKLIESFMKGNIGELILSKFEQDEEVKESHLHPQVVKAYKK